ncbi:MAG: preprotein translocase subunit SecG [Bacteroidetes bacterium]|nr:preprotein translocase subunit SecG [Bacteroidota bacterium]
MTILFFILIIITCGVLAFFVLIQNPKGGGLAGSFGGLGNQMMGAKQSTDVVEKGTWVAASVLLALTLLSFMLAPKTKTDINQKTRSETVGSCSCSCTSTSCTCKQCTNSCCCSSGRSGTSTTSTRCKPASTNTSSYNGTSTEQYSTYYQINRTLFNIQNTSFSGGIFFI